jgi:O-methyltransferase
VNANTDALGRLIRFLASVGPFRTSGDQVEVTELGATLADGPVVADIGGADGAMIARLLAGEPDRKGIVFDLPEIVTGAAKTIADHGLAGRVQATGGDFFDSVSAAGVYILSTILHDWYDESCRRILGNIARAARPGARLVIAESVIPPGDEPHPSKAVDLSMLVMLAGRERSPSCQDSRSPAGAEDSWVRAGR